MQAIDVHGHFGILDRGDGGLVTQLKSGSVEVVRQRAAAADVRLTVVSALRALIPYGGDVLGGNEEAREAADAHSDIRFWAVLNPRIQKSYTQVEALLAHPRCRGIKIHLDFIIPVARGVQGIEIKLKPVLIALIVNITGNPWKRNRCLTVLRHILLDIRVCKIKQVGIYPEFFSGN